MTTRHPNPQSSVAHQRPSIEPSLQTTLDLVEHIIDQLNSQIGWGAGRQGR
ncbi:hypothetical protein [Streptomyces sp. YGL11-2]|uniref:hypothetical protein n=1 Tax=Streptomyces sp. YGL11-2 TaxID=3414028 RepID=UPI003CE9D0D3